MLVRHLIRSGALLLICGLARRSEAQSTTSLLPDASTLPYQGVRFRVLTGWTRYDEFLGNGGNRNIGSILAIDSLGAVQIPTLAPAEALIRTASGLSNFKLNVGTIVAPANSRIVTAPIAMEYGVTSRITVGVVVPLVETRTTVVPQLNPLVQGGIGASNVGINPAFLNNSQAFDQNTKVVNSLQTRSRSLDSALTSCRATPSGSGCTLILGQQATVQSLVQSSSALAAALKALYGTDADNRGQRYVPYNGATEAGVTRSNVGKTIDAQIQTTATQLASFLGVTPDSQTVFGARGPGAIFNLNRQFVDLGRDTLVYAQSVDRTSIGDISVGASINLLNTFGDTIGTTFYHPQIRFTVNGTFRIGTGQPADRNRAFDIGTGYGQNGIIGGAAVDLRFGDVVSGSVIGSYTAQLGRIDVDRVANTGNNVFPLIEAVPGTFTAGNVTELTVIPRIRLAGYWALTGQYSFLHTDADDYAPSPTFSSTLGPLAPFGLAASTAQQIGFGFTYSTIVGPDRHPGRIPFEVSYRHLETLAGSGGPVNKTISDRVELKVYFNTHRRR